MLEDRLKKGKERLDTALEEIALVREPVPPPKDTLTYIHYFCGNTEKPEELKANEEKRTALYKQTVMLVRAYANIADELEEAGYTISQISGIKKDVDFYLKLREEIRKASGETLDLKTYEADMRHLIDTYIQAEESRRIDPFGDQTLIDIIVNSGIAEAVNELPAGIKSSREAIAETIENNVRQKIIKEHLVDPAYFEKMSILLATVIRERKTQALAYEEYLKKIEELSRMVMNTVRVDLPQQIKTPAQRALYHNLGEDAVVALQVHEEVIRIKKADFRGNQQKENEIKSAIYQILKKENEVERIFAIIKQQYEY
jgi:type I restriction enzyme R subunit